ncbi:proton-coupled amino acid transporter-like protein pathetic [Melitaea cinxia]|uniref:proton-coupled amino acid transporter-like protein pathetic n=1 Tax=Melitaea cinxia TaxID=113334 RepID=UPI001E273048|nr:proton-coupled amino acid transporter-like protein pathetic [Melitaea cinxia]
MDKDYKQEEYDPYEHRKVEKPSSDIRATANLIKASLGSGLLAGPLAFSNAGWGLGLIGTLLIGFICGHCIHILVKTSLGCCKIERKPLLSYAETCKAAFQNGPIPLRSYANAASIFAEFSLLCTYVGVCCIYTVLISDSIKQLIDKYVPSVNISIEMYCLITLIPLCMLCQIKYLKWLAIFSILANLFLFLTYLICLYYIFANEISLYDKKVVGNPARIPAFISTVIFAMEGIGVVMPVENAMKKPQHFLGCPSVLVVAMSAIVFFYSTLGVFGYLRYGDVLRGSITLNLPIDDWPAIFAKIFIALSIFFTYPLQFFVVFDIIKKYTDGCIKDKYRTSIDIVSRSLGVCFCVGIGIALPLLEQIINIVGACFYSILGLIIPGIIETVFRWQNLGKYNWILWKNILIVLFGVGSLISGCTVTIMDIIKILNNKIE